MKTILVILTLLCAVPMFAQERVSQWTGTVTTTNWISNKHVLGANDSPTGSISVWDSTGGSVQVAFAAADTAAAVAGASHFATVASGATFNFPARTTNTVYLRAVGSSATVYVVKY